MTIKVIAQPHPFKSERVYKEFKKGVDLFDILHGLQPDVQLHRYAHIAVNNRSIGHENWFYKPVADDFIVVTMVPQGGGGGGSKNPLRTVLSIGLLAAAPMLGTMVGASLGMGWSVGGTFIATGLGRALGTAIVGITGNLLVNAIAPPPKPRLNSGSSGRDTETLFIDGARNQISQYGVIPYVLGEHRIVPPQAAKPYTETVGDQQYVRQVFCWGYGPVDINDVRIGETDINEFDDVEIEHRYGYPDDDPLTLYTDTVLQNDLSVGLTKAGGWQVRTTEPDCDEISVDVTLPNGLVEFKDSGGLKSRSVLIEVQYAPTGTDDWSAGANAYKNIAAQDVRVIPPPASDYYISANQPYADQKYKRRDLVVLDRMTGTASVIRGTRKKGFYADGRPGRYAPDDPPLPSLPANTVSIAEVVFIDNDILAVKDARRDAFLTQAAQSPGDFAPALNGGQVRIAAGGLQFKGITATARKTAAIRKSLRFTVPKGQYDVRLRRMTADAAEDNTKIFDKTVWTALRSIRQSHPVPMGQFAYTVIRIRATDQLNGTIDQLNGIVSSIVPDWDGENWVLRATSNPASLYRHILQGPGNARALPDMRLDIDDLTGFHERCAVAGREYNAVLSSDRGLLDVANECLSAGRASATMIDGRWSVIEDRPQTVPVQHFTPVNSWGFSAEKAFPDHPHGLRVQFLNRNAGWQQDEMVVYDDGYDESNATLYETLELPGITDPDHIWKAARYHIATARLRPETYTFSADIEHIVCTRGDMVLLSHDVCLIGLGYGRIESVETDESGTVTAVRLDNTVMMEPDRTYNLRIRTANGGTVLQSVVTSAGETDTLTPGADMDVIPEVGDMFMFGEAGTETLELIVKEITAGSDLTATLVCVDAAPGVHSADTGVIPPHDPVLTIPPELRRPPAPEVVNIQSDESVLIREPDGGFVPVVVITLAPVNELIGATPVVRIKGINDTEWRKADILAITDEQVSFRGVEAGAFYDIEVKYRTARLMQSPAVVVKSHMVIGTSGDPSDVTGFSINVTGSGARLSWDNVPDVDISHYVIRYSPDTGENAGQWGNSIPLGDIVRAPNNSLTVPALVGTYLIKAVDTGGRMSKNATMIRSGFADLSAKNVVAVINEHNAWGGRFDKTMNKAGALELGGVLPVDQWPNVDDVRRWDIGPEYAVHGAYYFADTFDLGGIYTSRLTADWTVSGVDYNDTMDAWPSIDDRPSWDGDIDPSSWDVNIQVRWTDKSPEVEEWSEWYDFIVGDYTARAFQFRVVLNAETAGITPRISRLSLTIDMPDRLEKGNDVIAPAGGIEVSYTNPFRVPPALAITGQDMQTGDTFEIMQKSANGFFLRFYDATGNGVTRSFDYVAAGYGIKANL